MSENESYCFACGKSNPIGLKLEFSLQDGKCVAQKKVPREYQGYDGIVHGGIITTMLDEAMAKYLIMSDGVRALTAKLEIRYRQPTPTDQVLTITGREESRKQNFVLMKATVALPDGTITAEGKAQMAIVAE